MDDLHGTILQLIVVLVIVLFWVIGRTFPRVCLFGVVPACLVATVVFFVHERSTFSFSHGEGWGDFLTLMVWGVLLAWLFLLGTMAFGAMDRLGLWRRRIEFRIGRNVKDGSAATRRQGRPAGFE